MVGSKMKEKEIKSAISNNGISKKDKFINFMEALVTAAVVLVLIQTFAEDALVLAGASWPVRRALLISGFIFDVFFTIEFLVRFANAIINKSVGRYMGRENGWVDFAASIPLLVFTSGPSFLALMAGTAFASVGGLLGLLKVVKVIRMARVLRLLRLLKVVKRIKFADSYMVQRHSVRVITIAAAALIFTATGAGMALSFWNIQDADSILENSRAVSVDFLEKHPSTAGDWAESEPGVLMVKKSGRLCYARFNNDFIQKYFGPGDYSLVRSGDFSVWFDVRSASVSQSKLNIVVFLSALIMVAAILVGYSPHFAVTVGDPVNVMLRGLTEKSYNLEVKIPEKLANDDMFRLARSFNDEFLPLKARNASEDDEDGSLDISLDDIGDLLKAPVDVDSGTELP